MKSWSGAIQEHIKRLSDQLGRRSWWPYYVYHFTDVRNAVQIIKQGALYSRAECYRLGLTVVDSASPQVIQQTRPEYLDFVRLYFRPLTPTQFHNEGIRPVSKRELGAHCPVPVFFCFNALEILSRDDSSFSPGSLAKPGTLYGNDQNSFFSIPFDLVFHNERYDPQSQHQIAFHRHAEVLVPKKLPLYPELRVIICRSVAERQTLLHLLPDNLRAEWDSRVRLAPPDMFKRWWTYVEEVVVEGDRVIFRFNPNTRTPGPFRVRLTYRDRVSHNSSEWKLENQILDGTRSIKIPYGIRGEARLYIDDDLAFADTLLFDDVPF